MHSEVLVHAGDLAKLTSEVQAVGGRVRHVLTPRLFVIALPHEVRASSLTGVSTAQPERMEGMERALADAWISRFGVISHPAERLATAAASPAVAWDTAEYTPPDHQRAGGGSPGMQAQKMPGVLFSTDTQTSVMLTGSVSVGVVMVSGPPDPPAWTPVDGSLKYVSVGADGTVWGVNDDDEIYRWDGSDWDQVQGSLKQISVGNAASVWGVNSDDEIYRRDGNSWTQIQGSLKHVSVANDGTVWGVNDDDEIYRRDGNSWTEIPGSLKQISVGNAASVWGVNSDDEIYRRDGNSWTQIQGSLKHVSVANDGTVWGVNDDDEIYRWNGTAWDQFAGALKEISASSASLAWGVNKGDRIFTGNPGLALEFTAAERAVVMAEVIDALAFLAAAEPGANVSFVYDWQDIAVDVSPGTGND